jgi:hypothetical protein
MKIEQLLNLRLPISSRCRFRTSLWNSQPNDLPILTRCTTVYELSSDRIHILELTSFVLVKSQPANKNSSSSHPLPAPARILNQCQQIFRNQLNVSEDTDRVVSLMCAGKPHASLKSYNCILRLSASSAAELRFWTGK